MTEINPKEHTLKGIVLIVTLLLFDCTWNDHIVSVGKSVAEAKPDLWEYEREVGMSASQVFFAHLRKFEGHWKKPAISKRPRSFRERYFSDEIG